MERVAGKVAFVTGGASGIGFGIAQVLVQAGMKVAIADVNSERLTTALSTLCGLGGHVCAVKLDVSDRQAFARAADEAEASLGPVQLLCNNAGLGILKSLLDTSFQDWDWIMGVNLGGVFNGLKTFVPRMVERGAGGHIVSTASLAGLAASPGAIGYIAGKMAVVGMMEALRGELAKDSIGVSVLCPHFVRTNIYEHLALRPPSASGDAGPAAAPDATFIELVKQWNSKGMDPLEVGRKVLSAVRRNELYILSHPEVEGIIRERFEAMLAAIPHEAADSERVKVEADTLHYWVYTERRDRDA